LAATTPSLRDSTAANYDVIVAKWVLPRIGNQRLANLDAARIQALYGELSVSGRRDGGPLSPRSVRYVHAILQHALGDAVRWGVLPRNPAQFVDPPRQQRAELKVWSVDQVRAFSPARRRRQIARPVVVDDRDRHAPRRGARAPVG
jgi:hypothetical protein